MGLPQHWLQHDVVEGMARVVGDRSRARRLHRDPHPRQPRQLRDPAGGQGGPHDARHRHPRRTQPGRASSTASTPTRTPCSTSASPLLDGAQIMPYYFYMCDMIPFSEHWRVSVADAQRLQHSIMGYLPGLRDAAHRLRRAVRRQALGPPDRRLRRRARHLLLDQELPDLHRGRRPRGPLAYVRVLRPDPHPPRRRPGVVGSSTATSTSPPSRPPRSPRPPAVRPPSRPTERLRRSGIPGATG